MENWERWERFDTTKEIANLGWGHGDTYLTDDDIEYLKSGGILGHFDGEYTKSIQYKQENQKYSSSKIVETEHGVYINGTKIPFVLEDSVSVKYDGSLALVTMTVAANSFKYEKEPQPYHFKDQ